MHVFVTGASRGLGREFAYLRDQEITSCPSNVRRCSSKRSFMSSDLEALQPSSHTI